MLFRSIQETMRSREWQTLVGVLSLDLAEQFYDHLGCPIEDRKAIQEVAARVVRDFADGFRRGRPGEPFVLMRGAFLDGLRSRFGEDREEQFYAWVTLVWNELAGPTWDWFAYDFAFRRWYNRFCQSGDDSFCLGPHAGTAAELYRERCIREWRKLHQEIENWSGLSLSPWDRSVLDLIRLRIEETGPEEIGELSGKISGPATAWHFQQFWRLLVEQVGVAALVPIRAGVEEFVKLETSFPPRDLLSPADLAILPWLAPIGRRQDSNPV